MSEDARIAKPLGRKAYGSIGHLPGSRLGPGDHSVHEGQARICFTGRDSHGRAHDVVVQTKYDGSCVSAAKLDDGSIVALGRAGYPALSSKYEMHHLWDQYVNERAATFDLILDPGERLVGEWLAQAHGTIYELGARDPFIAFDLMRDDKRLPYLEFCYRVGSLLCTPHTLDGAMPVEVAMPLLDSYGAIGGHEGVVYRVENKKTDKVEFLAKWVRPDKIDGAYLNGDAVWNWPPERVAS